MSGWTTDVLAEISVPENDCCKLAFLSAAVHAAGTLEMTGEGRKLIIGRVPPRLVVPIVETMFGAKTAVLEHAVTVEGDVMGILSELGILSVSPEGLSGFNDGIERHLVVGDCCKAAYLAGAFAAAGSMTVGASGNRLQFAVSGPELAEGLTGLLSSLGVASFITAHKDKTITYIKRAQGISDCLVLIGATKTMLKLSEHLVEMHERRESNRVTNIEVSNILRAAVVGADQREAIRTIERTVGLGALDKKLRDVAELRLQDESATYADIAERLGISKPTVRYRLERLTAFAKQVQETQENRP